MFKKIAVATTTAAMGCVTVLGLAPAAQAAPTAPAGALACSKWIDYTDRGRAHAKCAGVDVSVTVKCANGRSYGSSPGWRWEYNKAECPRGIGATSMTYRTR
ncbi:hypothetical protein [Streptomyces sp. NPDC015131]|uniref:hypothetical protein n=1 Tax=Streptomyces sp. NPDC015131 TaxID=3364941 RepID=UPI0037026DFE